MHWDPVFNRLTPDAGPEFFKSYSMKSPLSTHFRQANCEEVMCHEFRMGFMVLVDLSTELGLKQYNFLTHDKKRSGKAYRDGLTTVRFVYEPGTICMRWDEHRVPIGRQPLFVVSGGDWRGNPRGIQRTSYKRPEDWVDDFANHQIRISEAVQRG